ncbi:Glutamine synthetase [Capillimicrobium parvum]|uniref:Glutamine synthetase n=2 Tax=Capillimicrobium parvum TaxID=2884022 RepID=A0A9E7C031_9ACTN|nr:Glutamine synthetase [Capillimicrobium parvum]
MPDLHGVARGKYVRHGDLEDDFALAAATYLIGHDVEPQILPGLSGDRGFPDVTMRAEPASLRPGWAPEEQLALASSYGPDGEPFALDPRHLLRRVVAEWEAEAGLTPTVAMELEFFVLEPDGDGGWRACHVPGARPYGTGTDVDPLGVARRLRHVARDAGLPIEGLSSEFFAGQFEVNLAPRDALTACDDVFLLRLLVRETVAEMGLRATFLPRPFNDRGGSGLHVNMSFFDAEGVNALDDPSAGDGLAPFAHHAIAGLLDHHVEMTALLAPTVNSYKRLRPDLMCGFYADWGYDNRFVTIRVPRQRGAATRLEARQADASGCPHLVTATLLATALDGVRRALSPPPPRDGGDPVEGAATVCRSLGDALDTLGASTALSDMLGRDLLDAFLAVKRHEWRRFTEHVTDWELAEYLPHH